MDASEPRAQSVLTFWFGQGGRDKRWFEKSDAFDAEVRRRFLALHEQAAAGALAGWRDEGCDIYAYFNNDWHGAAVADAQWLRVRLA